MRKILIYFCGVTLLGLIFWQVFRSGNNVNGDTHKAEFLKIRDSLENSNNPYLGRRQIKDLSDQLATQSLTSSDRASVHFKLASELLRIGQTEEAIEQCKAGLKLVPNRADAWLGIAYWRLAEVSNCIELHNRDCCIFPLQDGGQHSVTGPALKAKEHLLAYLNANPDDLARRWILNICAMALKEYPNGIPERFVIPISTNQSQNKIPRFVDIARQLGVDTFNLCGAVMTEDFDSDGFLDIVTSTWDPGGPLTMYRNNGNGSFEDVSDKSRLSDQLGGLNGIAADYDNDGDLDILVLRGGWLFDDGRIRNSLLQNDGNGVFTDVTSRAGLAEPAYPTQTAAWGDYDNDGDLDLYIGNESRPAEGANYPNQLFRNNGDGTFKDIAAQAGVTNDRYCKGVAAGDYDNDGDLDLYVSNLGENRLYQNDGNCKFQDVAKLAGVTAPKRRSFASWFFDYDNDGWLDIFVTAYDCSLGDIAADHLGLPHSGATPKLYRNTRDGTFVDVSSSVGLAVPSLPMGANFGDLDNDGWLDVYLTTGDPEYSTLTPNLMYRNNRGQAFDNVTFDGGFGHLQKGHGVSFFDFDNDGDQDIYNQLGGFYPGDKFTNALYYNPGNDNRFLFLKLKGKKTNSLGLGCRIKVVVETPEGTRELHRVVGSVSSFGGSPVRQEIGLGDATRIDRIEVYWPTSGQTQTYADIPLDSYLQVTEGEPRFLKMPLKPFRLKTIPSQRVASP